MVAPAVVLVTQEASASVRQVLAELRTSLETMRPDLVVDQVMLGDADTDPGANLQELVATGTQEITLIPLDLNSATEHSPPTGQLRDELKARFPAVEVMVSRPIGPASELLNILDARVRTALNKVNAVEIDALVLGATDAGDIRGQSLLARRARQWGAHHKLPVQLASNDATGRATGTAIMSLRAQGRRHIAVGSLFLAKDARFLAHWQAAQRAGAIAIADPIGGDPRMIELILARYAFAAMEMLNIDSPDPGA